MSNSPSELEFLAENEKIRIVPNFNLAELKLVSGSLGPFRSGLPIQVPVWLAINLRQRSKCKILIPDWLDVPTLQQVKDRELNGEEENENDTEDQMENRVNKGFTKMPSEHYMTLGKILLEICSAEIPNTDELRTLLKDIWDIRTSKFKKSIAEFLESGRCHAKVNNLTQMEMSSVRPFLPHAMEQMFRLTRELNNAFASSEATLKESSQSTDSQNDSQNSMPSTSSSVVRSSRINSRDPDDSQSQSQASSSLQSQSQAY